MLVLLSQATFSVSNGKTSSRLTTPYQLSKARGSFGHEITGLPPPTFPVFQGDNLDACDFAHFAADDVKGRRAATGN